MILFLLHPVITIKLYNNFKYHTFQIKVKHESEN